MNKLSRFYIVTMLAAFGLSACSDDDNTNENLGVLTPEEEVFGKANDVFSADEWYPGGELGTTEKPSYSAPAPAMDAVAGMEQDFLVGEDGLAMYMLIIFKPMYLKMAQLCLKEQA